VFNDNSGVACSQAIPILVAESDKLNKLSCFSIIIELPLRVLVVKDSSCLEWWVFELISLLLLEINFFIYFGILFRSF
jgi:hypothetical protein